MPTGAVKVIKTKGDYEHAWQELDHLMDEDPAPGTSAGDRLELLAMLVESYEKERIPEASEGTGGSMSDRCKHQWCYPHTIFEGRKKWHGNEIGVVRYCAVCGVKQMAFTKDWGKVPRGYKIDDVCK